MTQETARQVAERLLAEEREAERQKRLDELVRAEEKRRKEERREAEAGARRAAAKERDEALIPEHVRIVAELEEAAAELARKVEEYLAIRQRREEARRAADLSIPSGTARDDVGGYLNHELGPYVSPGDNWIGAGSPPLRQRDRLCPDEGGRG